MLGIIRGAAQDGRVESISLLDDNRFWAINRALVPSSNPATFNRPIVALDPGETTGLAVWDPSSKVILLAQLETPDMAKGFDKIYGIINYLSLDQPKLEHVRYEDYRVYGHMTESHAFSHLHTPRLCGAIEVACHLAQVKWSNCLAVHAKSFWTDEKLKMCGLYSRGMKHSRDAQRHLLRFMGEPAASVA